MTHHFLLRAGRLTHAKLRNEPKDAHSGVPEVAG
jgi:hypothetical protein